MHYVSTGGINSEIWNANKASTTLLDADSRTILASYEKSIDLPKLEYLTVSAGVDGKTITVSANKIELHEAGYLAISGDIASKTITVSANKVEPQEAGHLAISGDIAGKTITVILDKIDSHKAEHFTISGEVDNETIMIGKGLVFIDNVLPSKAIVIVKKGAEAHFAEKRPENLTVEKGARVFIETEAGTKSTEVTEDDKDTALHSDTTEKRGTSESAREHFDLFEEFKQYFENLTALQVKEPDLTGEGSTTGEES